jgi:hypothetical protein
MQENRMALQAARASTIPEGSTTGIPVEDALESMIMTSILVAKCLHALAHVTLCNLPDHLI